MPNLDPECALIHGADLEDFTRDSHACQPPGKDILLLTAERAKPKQASRAFALLQLKEHSNRVRSALTSYW